MTDITVKLFKATWCGHCNHFMPEWEVLQKECASLGIKTQAYDADAHRDEVEKEKIQGFPTIKIFVNGNGVEYNGPRSASAILNEAMKLKGQSQGRPSLRGGGGNIFFDKYRKYKAKYLRLKDVQAGGKPNVACNGNTCGIKR